MTTKNPNSALTAEQFYNELKEKLKQFKKDANRVGYGDPLEAAECIMARAKELADADKKLLKDYKPPKTKFTQGPWMHDDTSIYSDQYEHDIATLYYEHDKAYEVEEFEANARLILSAPKMYELLTHAQIGFRTLIKLDKNHYGAKQTLKDVNGLIAYIDGEDHE